MFHAWEDSKICCSQPFKLWWFPGTEALSPLADDSVRFDLADPALQPVLELLRSVLPEGDPGGG